MWVKRLLFILAFCCISGIASAQTCPTRPSGTSDNSCASTAFVSNAISPQIIYVTGLTLNSSGAAANNSTVIDNFLARAGNTAGGATLIFPCGTVYVNSTIDNRYSGVTVYSSGCTTFKPTAAIVTLKHRTPYGTGSTAQNYGGGFIGVTVDPNALATEGLEIDSISGGQYRVTVLNGATSIPVLIKSCTTGSDLAFCGIQKIVELTLIVTQTTTANEAIKILSSSNANFSGNGYVYLSLTHKDGLALNCQGADNNNFWFGSFRSAGGTGNAILMSGNTAGNNGCYSNVFTRLGSSYSDGTAPTIYISGTSDAGITSGTNNIILNLDKSNGTADPTSGTGSWWTYQSTLSNGVPGFYVGWGGATGPSGLAPEIFSNKGAEGIEFNPALAANSARLLFYNRTANAYISDTLDALQHIFNISGNRKAAITSSGLQLRDSSAAFDVILSPTSSSALTANRALTIDVVNGARTLKFGANLTIATDPGGITGALKSNGTGTFAQAACADLSNAQTGCSTATGTSGATIPLLNGANTWSGIQTFTNSDIKLLGSSTGGTTFTSANSGASDFTLTFPAVTDTLAVLGTAQTWTGTALQTFNGNVAAEMSSIKINNASSSAAATASIQFQTQNSTADVFRIGAVAAKFDITIPGVLQLYTIDRSGNSVTTGTVRSNGGFNANGTAGVTCGAGLGGTSRTTLGLVTTC